MPTDIHWLTHVKEAERCGEMADAALKAGNMISFDFWKRMEKEKTIDARIAKRRQEKTR